MSKHWRQPVITESALISTANNAVVIDWLRFYLPPDTKQTFTRNTKTTLQNKYNKTKARLSRLLRPLVWKQSRSIFTTPELTQGCSSNFFSCYIILYSTWRICCKVQCNTLVIRQHSVSTYLHQLLLLHPFNGLFSRTTWVSQYPKCKTSLDLNEARHDGVWGCSGISWTIC